MYKKNKGSHDPKKGGGKNKCEDFRSKLTNLILHPDSDINLLLGKGILTISCWPFLLLLGSSAGPMMLPRRSGLIFVLEFMNMMVN